jgi:serine/threonine protein kinase
MPAPAADLTQLMQAIPEVQGLSLIDDSGGFKAVYKAAINGRDEALKLIQIADYPGHPDADALREELIARVRREVSILSRCQSPSIVKLGSLALREVTVGSQRYLAYTEELLNGDNLWKILNSGAAKPDLIELKQLFASLLKAITELWTMDGTIHRDIKPQNIIKLNNPSRPFVLLDLGIAYVVNETGITLDPSHRAPMTFRYMAPEMGNPDFRDKFDFRTDIYTAGLTVFEYAAQKHPIANSRDDTLRTVSRALRQLPKPLKDFRPDLPPQFCARVDQTLKKLPALRPNNLRALLAEMEN